MNTTGTDDQVDRELRALLAQADPERNAPPAATDHLLARVIAEAAADHEQRSATHLSEAAAPPHQSWLQRHWQGPLLVAAGVAALALAAPSVLPGLTGGGTDEASSTAMVQGTPESLEAADRLGAGESELSSTAEEARGLSGDSAAAPGLAPDGTGVQSQNEAEASLVRSASFLVGTDEIASERDSFVATILRLGGRVTSETVVSDATNGEIGPGSGQFMESDIAVSSPGFPWYPNGPGVWLSVEVPVGTYEQAVAAARGAGEVVRSEQSSYDVGTQIADVDARIAALQASVSRLTDLMAQANGVTEVIKLEQAIATRQADLDALGARQRELTNQTDMSRLSLTLMSPEDARGAVSGDPDPEPSWWESLVAALGQFWSWLGRALLIVSPLLIAAAIIWWVRRRQSSAAGHDESPAAATSPQQTSRPDVADPDDA
jgi:hypothetical protein